jgi:uncharacterized protein YegL
MTIKIGNNFVDEETSRAVETEFGRGYRGINFVMFSGEKTDEVRKRMLRWKAKVDRAQRITVLQILGGEEVTWRISAYERTCTESQSAVQRAALIYSPQELTKGRFVSLYAPMSSRHQTGGAELRGE